MKKLFSFRYALKYRSFRRLLWRTDGAQLDGKFRLRDDVTVAMWKVVGPRNETLRATVSLEHCLPVSEETLTLERGTPYRLIISFAE